MLADDAAAWVHALRTDRRVITLTIAGYSDGSLLGMLAAQRAPVDACISIAGPPMTTRARPDAKAVSGGVTRYLAEVTIPESCHGAA